MRILLNFCLLLYVFTFVMPLQASTVRVKASGGDVLYTQGDPTVPSIILQLENTVLGEMPEVLIWQIGLDIVPADMAVGTVGFKSAAEPADYLFGGSSSPLATPFLPQTIPPPSIVVSDAIILSPSGVPLSANVPRNVVNLGFSVSANAEGLFNLVLAPYDGSSFNSSSWASQFVLNPSDANEFDNAMVGSSFESRVLATIHILNVPEPSTRILFGMGLLCLVFLRKRAMVGMCSCSATQ